MNQITLPDHIMKTRFSPSVPSVFTTTEFYGSDRRFKVDDRFRLKERNMNVIWSGSVNCFNYPTETSTCRIILVFEAGLLISVTII